MVGFRESRRLRPYILRDSLGGLKRMIHTHETVGSNPILATHGGSLAMVIKSQEAVGKLIIMK